MYARRGFHTFSDNISFIMNNINLQRLRTGDGAVAIAAIPGSDTRGHGLRCTATENPSNNAAFRQQFLKLPFNAVQGNTSVAQYYSQTVYFRVRMMFAQLPTNGQVEFARLGTSTGTNALSVRVDTDGTLDVYLSGSLIASTTETITANQWFEIGLSRVVSTTTGFVRIKRQGESSWTTLYTSTATGTENILNIQAGIISCSGTSATQLECFVDDFVVSDQSFEDADRHFYIYASGVRDASTNAAIIAIHYPDNLFRNATKARIVYSTDSTFATSTETAWSDLSNAVYHVLPFTITGLTPGTKYYYKFQIGDVSNNVLYETDEERSFWTFPDTETDYSYAASSCYEASPACKPYADLKFIADHADATANPWFGMVNLGDYGYADSNSISALDSDRQAAETLEEYEMIIRETACDIEHERLMRSGMYYAMADDHVVGNDVDARWATTLASTEANDWAQNPAATVYTTGTTKGQLWERGYAVWDAWFTHLLNAPSAGVRYQAKSFGTTKWIILDTRGERRPDLSLHISETQYNWLVSEIQEFGSNPDLRTLYIYAQDSYSTLTAKTSDGWERLAQAQWQAFCQAAYDNIPTYKKVFLCSGDDHLIFYSNCRFWRDGAYTNEPPFVAEFKVSGVGTTWHVASASDYSNGFSIDYVTGANAGISGGGRSISSSGMLFEVDANSTRVRYSLWVNNIQRKAQLEAFTHPLPTPPSPKDKLLFSSGMPKLGSSSPIDIKIGDATPKKVAIGSVVIAEVFDPRSVGASKHWAARLENYTNSQAVAILNDQIGTFHLSAQGTTPTFQTNQVNGLPAISFTGIDGYFQRSAAIGVLRQSPCSIFVVAKADVSGSGDRRLFHYGSAQVGTNVTNGRVRGLSIDPSWRFNGGSRTFNPPANPTEWHVWVGIAPSDATYEGHRILVDGVELTQLSSSNGTAIPNVLDQETLIGAGRNGNGTIGTYFNGLIAEVVFSPVASASAINYLGSKLAELYGLNWTNFAG